jgi:predicted DNA-binding transcriptional regulator AlpA
MPSAKPTKHDVPELSDRFITANEAALILGTSVNTLNSWRTVGRGPRFYRQHRSIRYLLSEILEWGRARCVEPERLRA